MSSSQDILVTFRWGDEELPKRVSHLPEQQPNFWDLVPQGVAERLARNGITPDAFNGVILEAFEEARRFFEASVAVPVRIHLGCPARVRGLSDLVIPDAYTFGAWKRRRNVPPYALKWRSKR